MIADRYYKFIFFLLLVFLLNGCLLRDDPSPLGDDSQEVNINDWIWEEMNTYYFWKDYLVDTDRVEPDHETYFKSLLYEDDRFSWFSDDAESLREELDGEILALGFSPTFGVFTNTDKIFIIVEFVYPGSNAEAAGLSRGDIILKVDGEDLTNDNYLDFYDKSEYTLTLGQYNGSGIYETDEEIFISNNNIDVNPIIYSEVKEVEGIKIGYLVYVDFISGNNDSMLDNLGQVMDDFKSEEITELIVDLRYNRGGNVDAAQYFGSLLAPQSQVLNRDVFVIFDYNDILEKYYVEQEGENSNHLFIRFKEVGHHLDLDQVVILTSSHTASASELVLVGLDPYMPVISIGEPTFGKFYGSFVIYDQHDPPRHNWAMVPVVLKYTNADGFTDFVNGVNPDFYISDNLLEAKPFGDVTDPMMAQAISFITGNPINENARIDKVKTYYELINWGRIRKGNIFKVMETGFSE
jgi:C-terminal processing protease CtpA/Prc